MKNISLRLPPDVGGGRRELGSARKRAGEPVYAGSGPISEICFSLFELSQSHMLCSLIPESRNPGVWFLIGKKQKQRVIVVCEIETSDGGERRVECRSGATMVVSH